jgi:hypothetical protein
LLVERGFNMSGSQPTVQVDPSGFGCWNEQL